MSMLETLDGPGGTPGPRARRWPRVTVALVLGLVLALTGWWSRHPTALADEAAAPVRTAMTTTTGDSVAYGLIDPASAARAGGITLVDVTPVVGVNTADAQIDVRICRGDVFGATYTPDSQCDSLDEVQGALFGADPDAVESLVLVVRTNQPGRVVVEAVDVSYRQGWQRGTAHLESHVVTVAHRPPPISPAMFGSGHCDNQFGKRFG